MQFEHLLYLTSVIENKSMNKAAKELYCSQPTISAAIKSIEKELGYPVIERTTKGVKPTKLGKLVAEDARLVLSYYDRWKSYASVASNDRPVEIMFTGTAPTFTIVESIEKAKRNNPDIKIKVNFKHEPDAALSHVTGRIGIQYKIPSHMEDAKEFAHEHGMKIALLQEDEFAVYLSSDNPLSKKDELCLDDLRSQNILLYQNPNRFPYLDFIKELANNLQMQMFQESNLMVAVALANDSVTIRPSKISVRNPYIETGKVTMRKLSDVKMPVNLYVSYPTPNRIFESEKTFMQSLESVFPKFEVIE